MAALSQITLYNWYLIRSGDLHAFDIAVGGFLSNRCIEGNRIETATIVERLENFKLLTNDGEIVNLVGAIDVHKSVANGFTLQMAHIFILGFPHIWTFLTRKILPLKDTGKVTSSQSNEVYDGEIHSQQRLQKENQLSAFEGIERHSDSYSEEELAHGVHYDPSVLGAKAFKERSESSIEMEHANFLLDGEFQCQEDPLLSNNMQAKNCDIEKGEGHCTERTQCDVQMSASDGVENHPDHVQVQPTANASIESESRCQGTLKSRSVEGFKMAEGELEMAKLGKILAISSLNRKKDDDCLVGDVEGEELSSAHLSVETRAKSVKKISGSDCQHKNELVNTNRSSEKQNSIIGQKLPAEKRKHKQRRKCLLVAKSKRRTTHKVENHPDQVHVESTSDAAIESLSWCVKTLKSPAVEGSKMAEGDLRMAKLSNTLDISSLKRKKVDCRLADDAEGGNKSYVHLSLEIPAKSPKKMCGSDSQNKDELIITNRGSEEQNSDIAQKPPNKKRKQKRRRKCLLARSKRCRKHKVENHPDQNHVESTADAAIQSVSWCGGTLKSTAVKGFKMVEGELEMAKLSKTTDISSLKRKKVDGHMVDDAEGGNLSYTRLSLETPPKSPKKMTGSDSPNKDELIITNRSSKKQNNIIAQILPAQKGNCKRRKKCLFAKSKRPSKHKSPEKLKFLKGPLVQDSSRQKLTGPAHDENVSSSTSSALKRLKILPPPLPSPLVPVPKELVLKAFGLKTSKSGRLLVPPLAHWCGQSLVRDMDGSIVAIQDGSLGTPSETGCFNFKPPIEPQSKRLQESLSKTASEYLTKEFNARRQKASWPKKVEK